MSTLASLAAFGARPRFARAVRCGQRHWPDWTAYRQTFDDIIDRQYYTNHGPLAQKLEARMAQDLGVRHAMGVTNEYISLALCAQALGWKGAVIVPALAPLATVQPLDWAGAIPLFCDVDPHTGLLEAGRVEDLLAGQPAAGILALNPWGDVCDVAGLEALAARTGLSLLLDSSQAYGCRAIDHRDGGFGRAEVYSLHSDQIVGAGEGGIICTNDDALAAHIRNIRSNYGMGPPVPVVKTGNGRMSEGQAALALYNLDRLDEYIARNQARRERYREGLTQIPGLALRPSQGVAQSNAQNLIVMVGEQDFGLSRDALLSLLRAENIWAHWGVGAPAGRMACEIYGHSAAHFPGARAYAARTLELPMHCAFSETDIDALLELLALIHRHAGEIRRGGYAAGS